MPAAAFPSPERPTTDWTRTERGLNADRRKAETLGGLPAWNIVAGDDDRLRSDAADQFELVEHCALSSLGADDHLSRLAFQGTER